MSGLLNSVAGLASPWLYVVVAALAAAESAALVGLVVPGEVALLIGGFAASQGRVNLPTMIVLATVAAVAGDSVGYELGRHFGPAVQKSRVGRWVGADRWGKAETFIERRGGPAVLLGRWVGLLRALVPGVAGMTRMPYRRFLLWNVLGAVVWAPLVVTAGFLAGNSFLAVEHWLGRASLLIGVVLGFVVLVWLGARWARSNRDRVVEFGLRLRDSRPVAPLATGMERLAAPVTARLRPHTAFLFISAAAMFGVGMSGWGVAETFDAVTTTEGVARLDRPVSDWFASHSVGWLTEVMKVISTAGGAFGVIAVVLLVSGIGWRQARSWRPATVVVAAAAGAVALSQTIQHLTNRPSPVLADGPSFTGYAFPSGHTTAAVAVFGAAAYLLARDRSWSRQVALWSGAVSAGALVGFSRAYLGAHWLTDVIGGWLLGTAWLIAVVASDALMRLGAAGSRVDPDQPGLDPTIRSARCDRARADLSAVY